MNCNKQNTIKQGMLVMKHDGLMGHFTKKKPCGL